MASQTIVFLEDNIIKDRTDEILNLLRPWKSPFVKKRYGKYVLHPEVIQQSDVLYTYDMNSAAPFESAISSEKQIQIKTYDNINQISGDKILIRTSSRFIDSINQLPLANVTGLILELYGLDQLEKHNSYFNMLQLLQQHLVITHIHGDNYDTVFSHHKIPKILEITFVSKTLVGEQSQLDDAMYPTWYDLPSNPQAPDLEMPFFGKNEFTVDWFTHQTPIWWPFVSPYMSKETHYLEIGSFEGRSISWMCRQILKHPDSRAYAVDTWEGSVEHNDSQKIGLMDRFLGSTHDVRDKVIMHRGFSSEVLKRPEVIQRQYDIMYVDGDHHCWSALEDAVLCFPLLKSGGLLLFDDYMYGTISSCTSPHAGINAFLHAYKEKVDILHVGYQVFLRKK